MGIIQSLRDYLALPAAAARLSDYSSVPFESPWSSPNHLISVAPPEDAPRAIRRADAMRVSTVARARRLIVGSIARCPLEARTGGTRADIQPRWMTRTDGIQSPWFRMTWTIDDLFFHGWSLWALERDHSGAVIRADRIPWEIWAVDAENRITINDQPVNPLEVCLIPGPDEGLLNSAAADIEHARALQQVAGRSARNPAAQVLLKQTGGQPLTGEQIRELVGNYAAARRGENGGIAFASQSVDVQELGKTDTNLLIEGRNAAAVDLARDAGVPASMVDAAPAGTGTLTYRNQDARNAELVDYCLAPYMAAVAARLGQDDMVPRGWAVAFDLSDLTSTTIGDLDVPDDDRDNTPEETTDEA